MTAATHSLLPVAIVGAGFSGTMTALQLLARMDKRPILLCERGERFARGAAYGTDEPGHLLNVRASNMSAFPDQPHHFVRWLERQGHAGSRQVHHTPAGTFVSRHLYGTYLTALLEAAVSDGDGAARLILVPDEVVDLSRGAGDFRLELAGGRSVPVAAVVLASGNLTPVPGEGPSTYVADPWTTPFAEGLDPQGHVVVLGSGLSMVDIALQLRHAGFGGTVTAVSRHGFLPQAHVPTTPWPTPALGDVEEGSPARLVRRLRREVRDAAAAGVGWQSVVDSIRPITATLWQRLGPAGRAQFLRHARAVWDVHRHRMAVPVGEAVDALLRDGTLRVLAGHVQDVDAGLDQARVTYRPRGSAKGVTLTADRVINAMGPVGPERCGDTLLGRLVERGLARPDPLRLGLDLAADGAVRGATGEEVGGLWAVGPLGRGVFWECTAVPDIRHQAAELAGRIAAALG